MHIPHVLSPRLDGGVSRVLASGVVALGVAMGVGRFAFTPLLPLMLRDGTLSAVAGACGFPHSRSQPLLVGGTFMVTTMAGLQLARELEPRSPAPLVAALTVAFALGQIAGPVVIRLLGPGLRGGWDALAWASGAATALLAGSSLWLWHFLKSDQTFVS